jgi:integrase
VWLAGLVASASSRRMVVQSVATLRVILATAVEWGRLAENPAAKLTIPAHETNAEQAVERVIHAEGMARVFESAGTLRTETMLRAAGEAGLRRGEIAGLRWPDVDLAARRLDVRRSIRPRAGSRGRQECGRSRRRRRAGEAAAWLFRARSRRGWPTGTPRGVVEGGADASGYVSQGKDGGPMHDRSLAGALERACERTGLDVAPHGLRHSCASIMLSRSVPLIVDSRQLGHANPNITASIYAHLLGDSERDRAAEVFDCAPQPIAGEY